MVGCDVTAIDGRRLYTAAGLRGLQGTFLLSRAGPNHNRGGPRAPFFFLIVDAEIKLGGNLFLFSEGLNRKSALFELWRHLRLSYVSWATPGKNRVGEVKACASVRPPVTIL